MIVLGADTSQIISIALAVPLLVAAQWGLLRLRNRVRDRIHGSPPAEPDLESVVRDALEEVFDEAAAHFDESLDRPAFRTYLIALAGDVAERAEATVELTRSERDVLRTALIDAVLDAFDLDDASH